MPGRLPPSLPRRMRGLDRVTNVLPVPLADLSQRSSAARQDATDIPLIRAAIFAADEQRGGVVHRRDLRGGARAVRRLRLTGRPPRFSARRSQGLRRFGLYVLPHALATALPSESTLTVA